MAIKPALDPILFETERSDITIQARFQGHFWSLFHNIPVLYSALLNRLGEFGVTPRDIRSDVGDNSLGGYNVNFWLFGVRALVRIRLDSVEIEFNRLTDEDIDSLERAFISILVALVEADASLALSAYTVDLRLHGSPGDVEATSFLTTFVPTPPSIPGPYIGAGAVFYFGESETTTHRTVTVDLSGAIPGKLYIRVFCAFKETLQPALLRAAADEQLTTALNGLGLTTRRS